MFPSLILAAFVASASAISILTPTDGQFWSTDGQNAVTWSSVSSDPSNFTIVLINKDTTIAPVPQELAALVNTADKKTTVNPPSQGWPAAGSNYTIRFVKSSEELNTLLAESGKFTFKAPAVASGSSASAAVQKTTPATNPSTPTTGAPANPSDAAASGSDTGADAAPTDTGAASSMSVHTGLVGALVLLSAMLAQF
ncbi:hypothetical protein DFH08DRAFT_727194 [Mycena albidolilacea]|uniref:Yeast cell wall synthesis Kre9/Knh1-like N-terminal domain-containing protein n=1 Tax=Mycena albidolilacea TaxID=1033008 RepID=A0AAD7AV72_9AGAR|nr:hypothetical protein DFH08DRAFT_727194 [Mycena albidolilacea]